MIYFLLMIISSFTYADPSWKWANATKVVEKHEFYKNNEVIDKPINAWQVLFAVVYKDSRLETFKDCLIYRVPGDDPGTLKLVTTSVDKECESLIYEKGNQSWGDLKALQYSVQEKIISLSLTDSQYQTVHWTIPLFNVFEKPVPKSLMSSAEYRAPKMIFLTPHKGDEVLRPKQSSGIEDKKICHDISEDCKELSPSTCSLCSSGWYEVPNGCPQGPKYCGKLACGLKNQPACRRGIKYQRVKKTYKCVEDTSFAYCAKPFKVHCQSGLPYCL